MVKNGVKADYPAKNVKKILITQPRPESDKSPYFELSRRYEIELVFHPFIRLEPIPAREFRKQKRKWGALHELNRRLEELRHKIFVVSTPTVPDKKIEQELGKISAESPLSGSSHYSVAEKKALISLMLQAQERGANAIVELHREHTPYHVAGKIQRHSKTIRVNGKAVKISDLISGNNKNGSNDPDTNKN